MQKPAEDGVEAGGDDDGVGGDGGDSGQGGGGGARPRRGHGGRARGGASRSDETGGEEAETKENGSYHCKSYKKTFKCDVCSHMIETRSVMSKHFKMKHAISGHNVHLQATQNPKLRWFVYLEEDIPCELQYVGSTQSMTHRWANTKKKCNDRTSSGTGLESHFKIGCPCDTGEKKSHIKITLLEHMDVTEEQQKETNHKNGPGCRCALCEKLKSLEDKWIRRMGTMHHPHGVNARDEIIRKSRCAF